MDLKSLTYYSCCGQSCITPEAGLGLNAQPVPISLQAVLEVEKFPIEDWLRSVPATELFDFMAAKLVALAERLGKK